jgi:hypothetical protein
VANIVQSNHQDTINVSEAREEDNMAQSSTSDPFSFFSDKDNYTVLFNLWQALRRSEKYERAAQECLKNLRALYDQWVTAQQALHPPPLSHNAAPVAAAIHELLHRTPPLSLGTLPARCAKRLLLQDLFLDNDALLQPLPLEALRAVTLELVTYWDWEDTQDRLQSGIADYERLIDTLACATSFFCSWDPSLESLPGESSKLSELDQSTLDKFTKLCSDLYQPLDPCAPPSALFHLFRPLETLRLQHGILLPLDCSIPQLPFLAARAVFPDMLPCALSKAYRKTKLRVHNILTFGPKVPRTLVHKAVNALLPPATSRLLTLERYCKAWLVYDFKQVSDRNGDQRSWVDIGRQVFPEDCKEIKHPFVKKNHQYRKLEGRIKHLYADAKKLIDTA